MARLENLPVGIDGLPLVPRADTGFDLRIDETARIIRTSAHGFWTLAQTEDYLAELAEIVDESRARFGRSRVLADWRGSPIQSEAVGARLAVAATFFAEHDRVAVVVESSLAKGQMRRRLTHPGSQAFLSYTAAELWLTAWP